MLSYVRIACPNCPRTLRVRQEYLGQRIVCNHCQHPFLAESEWPAISPDGLVAAKGRPMGEPGHPQVIEPAARTAEDSERFVQTVEELAARLKQAQDDSERWKSV